MLYLICENSKSYFHTNSSFYLIHKYISGHGHVICFPCFVLYFKFKWNIFLLWSQYWNTQTRSNLWVSADWVVKIFHLWEELKAPKNEVIVAPFTFEQRCSCRRSYSKALSFFLSDCLKKNLWVSTRTGYALRLTLYRNTNAVLTDTCVPSLDKVEKCNVKCSGI